MAEARTLQIEVVVAWPRRHLSRRVAVPIGATAGEAAAAAGFDAATLADVTGYAVHGERVEPGGVLRDGDRLELLRALEADPKVARHARAERQRRR